LNTEEVASADVRVSRAAEQNSGHQISSWSGHLNKLKQGSILREVILASWRRSAAAGLDRGRPPRFRRVSDAELAAILEDNRELIEVAKPHVDWISAFLTGIEHVVYITDRNGIVLYSVGDLSHSEELHLSPGHDWSEETMGTNGSGTAIAADCPVAIVGADHFATAFDNCTCTGAPLHRGGVVVGAIDVSTAVADGSPDRVALVAHVAFVIDRELALLQKAREHDLYRRMAEELRRSERELLETNRQLEALLNNIGAVVYLVDKNGRLLRVNRRWEVLFDVSRADCVGRSLDSLFPRDVADRFATNNEQVLEAGRPLEFEEELSVQGELRTYLSVKVPIFDDDGRPYAICGISADITERRAAEQRERKILQKANQRKERFVTALAHELRSPIAAIVAASEVLQMPATERARVEPAAAIIQRQATHIANVVEKLLEASRAASLRVALSTSRLNLATVVEQAVEAVRPAIETKGLKLEVSIPPEPIEIDGDETRLTQVLVNLLENACRYSDTGKMLFLAVRRVAGEVVVTVRDEGRGIAPEALPNVFDLLFQADESGTDGLGLGLALVKGIVGAHGGAVDAHSRGSGCGSEFVVRLPSGGAKADGDDEGGRPTSSS
jgi:PAS domain S-box-containing protein